ncbi:MAG: hypothetical protein A2583_01825 [Bdellovibrionales bacterium RIFOXYD1_FULL_53_11]|nr:MAG: hypothetical protein A2583_01825 [Bdellovibrionales bacterium RIFOXYD1_FULL_53_11]
MIPDRLFFRIRDAAEIVGVKPYVLRYWESEFPVISPDKSGSGQRVYKRADLENLLKIKHLLYSERYSIEGARKRLRELKNAAPVPEAAAAPAAESPVARKSLDGIRAAAIELREEIEKPLEEIFRC